MQEGTPIIIKKIKKHGHGHHGGAWKVAYADFVTAMMAFFMVMWILGMSDEQKASVSSYFKDPVGFGKMSKYNPPNVLPNYAPTPGTDGKDQAHLKKVEDTNQVQNLQKEIEGKIQADPQLNALSQKGDVDIKITQEGLQIELIENETDGEVFFQLGSAVVRPKAEAIFKKIAPIIGASKRPVCIDGHTDNRPLNQPGYDNFSLSGDRANAVRMLLLKNGVKDQQVLEVRAKGDKDPRMPDHPDHFSNRRVSILLPYKYIPAPTIKLPSAVSKESVQGLFRMYSTAVPNEVDLTRRKKR